MQSLSYIFPECVDIDHGKIFQRKIIDSSKHIRDLN